MNEPIREIEQPQAIVAYDLSGEGNHIKMPAAELPCMETHSFCPRMACAMTGMCDRLNIPIGEVKRNG